MGAPFFIVGASRSGTTMMRLLLNAHSRIGVPKELAYFERCARAGWFSDKKPAFSTSGYRTFVRAFLAKKKRALEGVDLECLEREILAAGPADPAIPFRYAIEAWLEKEGKSTWGEKTPKNVFYVDKIHEMFPAAKFIYVIRDPRAAVHSMNRFIRFIDDSVVNSFNWLQAATMGYSLLTQSVPAEQRLVVKYEDLVTDVEATTRTICTFLGEHYEPAMLDFYTRSLEEIHPAQVHLGGVQTLTRPISTARVDTWRYELPARDRALIEWICGDAMAVFGYERVGEVPTSSDLLKMRAKLLYCDWQQHRHRLLRAYQIAFRPFARTRGRLRKLFHLQRSGG